jgi:hypothetical protein
MLTAGHKIIVLYFKFNFFLPLIFTLITYHFVPVNVMSDMCQINGQNTCGCSVANSRIKMFLIVLPTQTVLIDHLVHFF